MFFVFSVASMRSDRGCTWRPLVTGAPPPHPASVICAAIAADASSARRRDRESVNWSRTPAPIPNMTDARSGLGLDQGKRRLTINSASVGKQKLTPPFLKCDEGDRDRSSPPGSAETKSAAAVDNGAVTRAP